MKKVKVLDGSIKDFNSLAEKVNNGCRWKELPEVEYREGRLYIKLQDRVLSIPVVDVEHWETEEDGFIVEEGYIYTTPYGKINTEIYGDVEKVVSIKVFKEALKVAV